MVEVAPTGSASIDEETPLDDANAPIVDEPLLVDADAPVVDEPIGGRTFPVESRTTDETPPPSNSNAGGSLSSSSVIDENVAFFDITPSRDRDVDATAPEKTDGVETESTALTAADTPSPPTPTDPSTCLEDAPSTTDEIVDVDDTNLVGVSDAAFFPPKSRNDGDAVDVIRRANLMRPEVEVGVNNASGTRTDEDFADENKNFFLLSAFSLTGGSDDADAGNDAEIDETGVIATEDVTNASEETSGNASFEYPVTPDRLGDSSLEPHDAVSTSGDASLDDAIKRPTLAISSIPSKKFSFLERMSFCNKVDRKTSRWFSKPGGTDT